MATKDKNIKRIALTGPESTGKTSLATDLAGHYKTVWVPEFSRDYLEQLGRPYEEEDLLAIARGQRKSEKNLLEKANRFLFCDTDMFVMKIWSAHKYGTVNEKILQWIEEEPHDLYLLCYPDLQWEHDPLRENPAYGDMFYKKFLNELEEADLPFEIVSGKGNDRVQSAISAVERNFPS